MCAISLVRVRTRRGHTKTVEAVRSYKYYSQLNKAKPRGVFAMKENASESGVQINPISAPSVINTSEKEHKEQVWALDVEARRAEIESKKDSWDAGCGRCSGGLVRYLGQMICCASVLAFSFVQIGRNPNGENSVYFSLMSGILGYVLPAPQIGT